MTEVEKKEEVLELEPIVGHLVVKGGLHSEFLNATTSAIKKYTKQGYEVETHYQMVTDPNSGELTHSAYLVGKLKETKPEEPELITVHIPHVSQEALSKVEEWVESYWGTGHMPNGIYNTIMDLIDSTK